MKLSRSLLSVLATATTTPSGGLALIRIPTVLVSTAIAFVPRAYSFSLPISYTTRTTRRPIELLEGLITGEAKGEVSLDENEGGVGLAKRTAVKIVGVSRKGNGSEAQGLLRYKKMHKLDAAEAKSIMERAGCQLLCLGAGKEIYEYLGSANRPYENQIVLAPTDAARNALESVASAAMNPEDVKLVTVNFLGGDDLILGEVLEACDLLVNELDFPVKAKVTFNSLSYKEVPVDVCTVTVVVSRGSSDGLKGADESVARGELYIRDGQWFTLAEGDIETAQN